MAYSVPNAFQSSAGPKYQAYNSSSNNNGLGGIVGNILGFDITPNYNLTTKGFVYNGPKKATNTGKKDTKSDTPQPTTPQDTYSSSYGAGGSSAGSGYSAADLAYLDDQEGRLRNQQSSADRAFNSGLTQLNDSYGREVSKANANQSRTLQDILTKREDTTRAKDKAIGQVDTNARTLADSLRRRIGMAAGSGSSAYQIAAPGAVARQASQERGDVVENYGTNFRNLDTTENRVKDDFKSLLDDLLNQKNTRERDFRSSILDRKNQIDTSLAEVARQKALVRGGGYDQVKAAMAPFSGAIDARQGEIDTLFDKYRTPFEVKQVDTTIPELRQYLVDRAQIQADQAEGASPDSPYSQFLKKQQDEALF